MSLTSTDLSQIEEIVDRKLDEKLDTKFVEFEQKLDKKFDIGFQEFEQKLDQKLDDKLQNHPTRDEFAELMQMIDQRFKEQDTKWNKRFKSVPTRDELYGKLDAILYEMQEYRTEQVAISHRLDKHDVLLKDHSAQIKKVEKHLHLAT